MFHVTTHRSDTIQRIRLGTDRNGRILAIGHDVFSGNLRSEQTCEGAAIQTRTLYAGDNRLTRHRLAPLDIPVASSMRAPGEAVGLLALECAMDELAEKLDLDPIELRMRNEPTEDPEKHIPYSSRHLIRLLCRRRATVRLGPAESKARPVAGRALARRNGRGCRDTREPAGTVQGQRAAWTRTACVVVRMAMTDIGTGTYTILTQIAAEMLGLPTGSNSGRIGRHQLSLGVGLGRLLWRGQFGLGPVRRLQ